MSGNRYIIPLIVSTLVLAGIVTIRVNNRGVPEAPQVLGETTVLPTDTPTIIPTENPADLPLETPSLHVTPVETVASPPISTPIPTPTNTRTPQTSTTPAYLNPQTPTLSSSTPGNVTTLNYTNLSPNTLYKVDLSFSTTTIFVVSWPKGKQVLWTTDSPATLASLTPLPLDEDDGNETESFSGMLSTPPTKVIYLYPQDSVATITVSLITTTGDTDSFSTQTTGAFNYNAGASYTTLPIVSRDEWGANPGAWDSNSSADIDAESRFVWFPVYYRAARIVVHHTATAPNTTTPAAAVRAIYLYHTYIRNWGDIGYNYLIDQNGTIYQGKLGGDETQGYHAFGAANRMSIGISLIGDFTYGYPTTAARNALIKLMAEKAAFYGFTLRYSDGGSTHWRDINYTVFGHRTSYSWDSSTNTWNVNQTACPGNKLAELLPSLTQSAEAYKTANFTQLKSVVEAVDQSFSESHEQGVIIVKYDVPSDTPSSVIESYLPKYSGITSYTIDGNTVTIPIVSTIITHPYYNDSEYLLPPMNWTGYDGEYATFLVPFSMNGPEDRAKTLLKIFKLDPRVAAADLHHQLTVQ